MNLIFKCLIAYFCFVSCYYEGVSKSFQTESITK